MLPGYISFMRKIRGAYGQGSGTVHEAFCKVQQHENIMGEEQACGTPWAEILCSGKNLVLRLCYQPPAQIHNSAQEK